MIESWKYKAGSGVASVAISADGETVLAGALGKRVLCLDGNGNFRWTVDVGNQAWRVELSADGQTAIAGTGSTRPWDMQGRGLYCCKDGALRWKKDLEASVWGMAISANGEVIAVGTNARQLLLFDHQSNLLWQQSVSDLAWFNYIWSVALSADGWTVVAGSADKRVRILDRGGSLLAEHRTYGEVFTVAVSADGRYVAAGDNKRYVYLFDRHGHLLWEEQRADKIWAVALTAHGERVLIGTGDRELHLILVSRAGQQMWRRYVGGSVSNLAMSADGRRIVAGTRDGGIHFFGEDGTVLHRAFARKSVRDVAISADGTHIVAGSADGVVYGFQLPLLARVPAKLSPRLQVFLCHASDDKPAVHKLYERLRGDGFDPWLDSEKILPGQVWENEIRKAVTTSDVVLVCLSRQSTNKAGFVQKEIKFALEIADERPGDAIFLVPLKLEECEVPDRLRRWQWANLFEEDGYQRLLDALHHGAIILDTNVTLSLKEVDTETVTKEVVARLFRMSQKRLNDLAELINKTLTLLKEYEDKLMLEDDPRRKAKYRDDIAELRLSLTLYYKEYEEWRTRISDLPAVDR